MATKTLPKPDLNGTQAKPTPKRSRKEQLELEKEAYEALKKAWQLIYKEHNPDK